MAAYHGRLTIDYGYLKIPYSRSVELPDRNLTLDDISTHLNEGETFHFSTSKEYFSNTISLDIFGTTLETEDVRQKRISKAEAYNARYDAYWAEIGGRK